MTCVLGCHQRVDIMILYPFGFLNLVCILWVQKQGSGLPFYFLWKFWVLVSFLYHIKSIIHPEVVLEVNIFSCNYYIPSVIMGE